MFDDLFRFINSVVDRLFYLRYVVCNIIVYSVLISGAILFSWCVLVVVVGFV